MTQLESVLLLMLAAIVLLQASRRFGLPYPSLLALAGVLLALVPGTPKIAIEPVTALAIFVAPPLLDAAFDFPLAMARRFWAPLAVLAIGAVLLTAASVATIGVLYAGLPIAAAVALGAIVAPPDAAAASAVMRVVDAPEVSGVVLRGESLFNDATALLLFAGALAVHADGELTAPSLLRTAMAAPGGIAFGVACAFAYRPLNRALAGTLGGTLLQFLNTVAIWLVADRLDLSAVLAVVAFGMTIARIVGPTVTPRARVHSYAVWTNVIFALNVFAFLVMGLQIRAIVATMTTAALIDSAKFAGIVLLAVIAVRLAVTLAYTAFRRCHASPGGITWSKGLLVGWAGMRGMVTLAAAYALPADFPKREMLVLAAFAVVLGTLAIQGLTLPAVIRLLKLDGVGRIERETELARRALADAGLAVLPPDAEPVRARYALAASALTARDACTSRRRQRRDERRAIAAERERLDALYLEQSIGVDVFDRMQEELDWRELAITDDGDDRQITEG